MFKYKLQNFMYVICEERLPTINKQEYGADPYDSGDHQVYVKSKWSCPPVTGNQRDSLTRVN